MSMTEVRQGARNGAPVSTRAKRRQEVEAALAKWDDLQDRYDALQHDLAEKNMQIHKLVVEIEVRQREVDALRDRAIAHQRERDEAVAGRVKSDHALITVRDALDSAGVPSRFQTDADDQAG